MAIYEDRCANDHCQAIIETQLSISSSTLVLECPYCGQPLHRIVSSSSFHLKGSGWYKDGYNNKGVKK